MSKDPGPEDESGRVPWQPYTLDDWLEEERQKDPEFERGFQELLPGKFLGAELGLRREDLGLTQAELAERTGIKQPMICRIERGQEPTLRTLRKLAVALQAEIRITPDGKTMTVVAAADEVMAAAA